MTGSFQLEMNGCFQGFETMVTTICDDYDIAAYVVLYSPEGPVLLSNLNLTTRTLNCKSDKSCKIIM
jgi:hypothetical protein